MKGSEWVHYRVGCIRYAGWEWAVMRWAFAVLLWEDGIRHAGKLTVHEGIRSPHGLGRFVDVAFVGNAPWEHVLPAAFFGGIMLYAVGVLPMVALTGLVIIHTLMGTFVLSQGSTMHSHQIIGILLLAQWLACAWHTGRDRRPGTWLRPEGSGYRDLMIHWSQQAIAAAYVTTGLTKVIRSEGKWIREIPNLAVQFEKNLLSAYYNNLEPVQDHVTQWTVTALDRYPVPAQIAFTGVLLLELLAFLALWNRRVMAVWGVGLIAMHLTIGLVMKLHFFFNEMALLIFLVHPLFWGLAALTRLSDGRPPARSG